MAADRTILVTGPSGFIGQRLMARLAEKGFEGRAFGRDKTGDLSEHTDWTAGLEGVDTVIHLAGRAHVMKETATDVEVIYNRVNRDTTASLVQQAQAAGVRRIVYVSTSKVMGESGGPFSAGDTPNPVDPYSRSKLSAETFVRASNDIESVIIRPPLVYGPCVKGNFIRLLQIVDKGVPLPFGAIQNRRSLIGLDNMCDALMAAIDCPEGTYLPADKEQPSTALLVSMIAEALGRRACLLPVPVALLKLAGQITGRSAAIDRLTGDFVVDGKLPGWEPEATMTQQLAETIKWYRNR